jgi:tRNA (cytidine/uridine-2'-O-)-methyltransferase
LLEKMTVQLAMYQPDMPPNLGSMVRLCAATAVPLHIIEPCGFPLDDKRMRRVAMDYLDHVTIMRHASWVHFKQETSERVILLTTKTEQSFTQFDFHQGDVLLLGRESAGAPEEVHQAVDAHITIPMRGDARSLNVVQAATMVLGEALRQTRGFLT